MPTPEQQIQKIIDDTVEVMTGTLFEVTANVDPADIPRVINAVQLDLFTDAMESSILKVLDAGFVAELSGLTQISPLSGPILQSYIDIEGASFLANLGNLGNTVKNEVAKGILTGAGRSEIARAITGSTLSPAQLETLINTGLSTFSRTINTAMQNELPVETKYRYEGPLDEKTRPICIEMIAAGALTIAEIDSRFPGSRTDGGGFNCRHGWFAEEGVNINQEHRAGKIKDKLIAEDKFGKPQTLRQIQSERD
jgi:hypothetical protein|uniref:Phage head morphogenesis domain-containing protein n=1 Tax=uncultured marine virus TaxID=186617 RepID=A0A0F7L4I6_9VIRU|nr:hypothetical protein [uncultured marine virus]